MSYYTVDPNTGQLLQAAAPAREPVAMPAQTYAQPAQVHAVPPAPVPAQSSLLGLDVSSSAFWKGALVGAGVTVLLTSETVQKAVVKTLSRGMAAASAGVEEMKEKYEDAKAEVEAEAAGRQPNGK